MFMYNLQIKPLTTPRNTILIALCWTSYWHDFSCPHIVVLDDRNMWLFNRFKVAGTFDAWRKRDAVPTIAHSTGQQYCPKWDKWHNYECMMFSIVFVDHRRLYDSIKVWFGHTRHIWNFFLFVGKLGPVLVDRQLFMDRQMHIFP
jgi:hypothetical protein